MSTKSPESASRSAAGRDGWRDWLLVAVVALLLLTLSEALWLWQTWQVRELLQATPSPTRPASAQ